MVRGVVQNFSGNSPWKEVPKTGFKIWGLPQKNFAGGVIFSPNFAIFRLFCLFLQNGARYHQSKKRICNLQTFLYQSEEMMYFCSPWIKWSKLENTHPPIWLPVFIQSFSPGATVGGGIPIWRSSVEIISSLWYPAFSTSIFEAAALWFLVSWSPATFSATRYEGHLPVELT